MPSLEERKRRVAEGSRRKRDLLAVAAERRAGAHPTAASLEAWAAVDAELRFALPSSTLRLLSPAHLLGEHDNALVLGAPPSVAALLRRRYGKRLGATIRSLTDFRGVFICEALELESDGCL